VKHYRLALLVVFAMVVAACTTSSPRRSGRTGPAYAPPPPGQSAPPGQVAPAAPAPVNPLGWLLPKGVVRLPAPPPSLGIFRPVNTRALVANMHRYPCKPAEVSPGNWVGFDCSPPSLVSRASRFVAPRSTTSGFTGSGGTVGSLPDSVDHRSTGMEGPIKNQGAVGTCTAVSLSSAMEHAYRTMGLPDTISAIHVWSQYRVPKMGEAGDSNIDKRITVEQTWPYDPAEACKMMRRSYDSCGAAYDVQPNTGDSDPTIQGKQQQADASGRYRLVGVEKLDQHDPAQFASLIAGGDDLWVAFNVNTQNWTNSAMNDHVIQDYTVTEATGHAVVLAGYRTVGGVKQFLIHNSWGPEWGDNGYAWISENMVRNQLRYAYRVRVAHPSDPSPANPGSNSGGCPAGQSRDMLTGQCTGGCPSGTIPAGGMCAPALPGMPGPSPSPSPGPSPAPSSGGCPQGQAADVLTGQCGPTCPNGQPSTGGLCLPQL
jgi:hypothetical protein